MPITLVEGQLASGSFSGTSGTATLPAGTTAGNTVLLVIDTNASTGLSTPSGFTADRTSTTGANKLGAFHKSNVGAGETSYTITVGVSSPVAWEVREYSGIDPDFPLDVSVAQFSASASSITAGATPTSTSYDGLLLCAFGGNNNTTTPTTWSGHTGGVVEDTDQGAASASNSVGLSVASLPVQSLAAWSSTATASVTGALASVALVYVAAGAKRLSDPVDIWGFEWLTTAGMTLGADTLNPIFGASTGAPEVVTDATKARTGSGYLRLSATAAAENLLQDGVTITTTPKAVLRRVCVRFDGGLPTADTALFHIEPNSGGGTVTVRFITSTSQLGLKVGTGTEQVSDATVTADTWIGVDVRLNCHTTSHTADWQVTYDATPGAASTPVAQPQASFTASAVPGSYQSRFGWTTAITPGVPVLFDDCVDSIVAGGYPLGDHRVYGLGPDAAGTVTVSGSTANFGVMTANGTVAAWNAANALAAIDDIPPTLGASADGVVATAASATDYVEVPMATQSFSGIGSIRAVRPLLPLWAASATAATCRVDGYDGSAATSIFAEFDPQADTSSTPPWVAKMWKPSGGWTQAKLDAAALRFGSNDATPDIGFHCALLEVAVQIGATQPHFGTLVASTRDPVSAGILGISVTPTLGYDATLHYENPSSTDVPAPGGATTSVILDAPDAPSVGYVAAYPPAEDISDA